MATIGLALALVPARAEQVQLSTLSFTAPSGWSVKGAEGQIAVLTRGREPVTYLDVLVYTDDIAQPKRETWNSLWAAEDFDHDETLPNGARFRWGHHIDPPAWGTYEVIGEVYVAGKLTLSMKTLLRLPPAPDPYDAAMREIATSMQMK